MEKSILNEFWNYIETEKENTKIAQKVYNWLQKDNLLAIQATENIFYFEVMHDIPNYVFKKMKGWAKKHYNIIYMYDYEEEKQGV